MNSQNSRTVKIHHFGPIFTFSDKEKLCSIYLIKIEEARNSAFWGIKITPPRGLLERKCIKVKRFSRYKGTIPIYACHTRLQPLLDFWLDPGMPLEQGIHIDPKSLGFEIGIKAVH